MRAIAYIRVSTDEQANEGHSLAMQPERARQWCALQDLLLVEVIRDDGVSAGTPLEKRKGGAALIQALRERRAEVVVVYRLDRLFRDVYDGLSFFREVAEPLGVTVHSITELIDTSTPQGRLNLNIQLTLAQYERELAKERTRAVISSLRARGRVYGSVPYGCIEVDGQLYRDPEIWPHRETIVDLAHTPAKGRRMSLAQIAMALRKLGIPAPQGGAEWSKSSVSRVVSTHGELNHIPVFPVLPEPAVSEAAIA